MTNPPSCRRTDDDKLLCCAAGAAAFQSDQNTDARAVRGTASDQL